MTDSPATGYTVYLARHGETEWNAQGLIQGQLDSPLTARGEEQARALGDALRAIPFDAIFSSDLERARRTAELAMQGRGLSVQTTPLLRERQFGQLQGQHHQELSRNRPLIEELADGERFRYKSAPDIESDEELIGRLLTFLREVARACEGKTILAVTHGGLMRAALIALGYGTYANFSRVLIGHTAWAKLVSDGVVTRIQATGGVPVPEESDAAR